MTARLPTPGGDNGDWGDILNAYLEVSLNSDGTLQTSALQNAGGVTSVNNTNPTSGNVNITASSINAVPNTTTVNGHALSSNVTLSAGDVSAIPSSQLGAASGVATLDSGSHLTAAQLPSSVVNASGMGGIQAWAPSTVYTLNQLVTNSGTTYICSTAHTSGSTFSAESGDWQPIGSGGGGGATIINAGSLGASYTLALANEPNTQLVGSLSANCAVTVTGVSAGCTAVLLLQQDTTPRTLTIDGTPVTIPTATGAFFAVLLWSPDGSTLYVEGSPQAGTQWWTGAGNPGTVTGAQTGDLYLNKTNGEVWKSTSGSNTWADQGFSLLGPTGPAGPTGPTGPTGTTGPTGPTGLFGDGSDSAITLDGTTSFAAFATLAGSTYTLTRPIYATTLVINLGVTLKPVGFPMLASLSITVNGTIDASGSSATTGANQLNGGSGATFAVSGLYGSSARTGAAGSTTNGGSSTAAPADFGFGTPGNGGAGSGGTAGTGNGNASFLAFAWYYRQPAMVQSGAISRNGAFVQLGGGSSGGGGGGDSTNAGGGGGGGAGVIVLFSPSVTVAGTGIVRANGGNGGSPTTTTGGCGGGGGGAGGVVAIYTISAYSNSGTVTANGGAHGTPVGSGGTGTAGTNGSVINVVVAS